MTRASRTAARRARMSSSRPTSERRLEAQPLAHRPVGGQQLAVHGLQHRSGVDAEPVGQLVAVPLVAVQGGGCAVHGGRSSAAARRPRSRRRRRHVDEQRQRLVVVAERRERPAQDGPRDGAVPGRGGAQLAERPLGGAARRRERQRRAGQVAGPDQVVAALGLAGSHHRVAQRQRVDRRRPAGRAGSRGRSATTTSGAVCARARETTTWSALAGLAGTSSGPQTSSTSRSSPTWPPAATSAASSAWVRPPGSGGAPPGHLVEQPEVELMLRSVWPSARR